MFSLDKVRKEYKNIILKGQRAIIKDSIKILTISEHIPEGYKKNINDIRNLAKRT